ncbi:MAG: DJ-1/PfpI family protein [Nitrospinota bacterium]|nr:DJ-1/PfpI family protein [Nitrospinota bacterium]
MARLEGKNILIIIPKDYYDERELDACLNKFRNEGANVRIASSKLKEAVGMKTGRIMPDLLVVDAIEGITGDSYVTGGKGTRQIIGVFHGVVVIGGSGTRKYVWNDKLVRLLLLDRYKSDMVIAAIGQGVPALGIAGLTENIEVAAPQDKFTLPELDKAAAILVDENLAVHDRIITASGAEAADEFTESVIEAVQKTPRK